MDKRQQKIAQYLKGRHYASHCCYIKDCSWSETGSILLDVKLKVLCSFDNYHRDIHIDMTLNEAIEQIHDLLTKYFNVDPVFQIAISKVRYFEEEKKPEYHVQHKHNRIRKK